MSEKIFRKMLARDENRNLQIDKIRIAPNAKIAAHAHPDFEWIYVLRGEISDDRGVFRAGDFFVNEKNSKHAPRVGADGCEILCVWCGKIEEI